MAVEMATGKAKCTVCGHTIRKGASCWHHTVNSRAAPFFCSSCLGSMHRQVSGLSTEYRYEVHQLHWGTPEEIHMAKRAEYSGAFDPVLHRSTAEGPWLCEIPDMAYAERDIALAEGIPTENVRLSATPKFRGTGPDVFFVEIPNSKV